MNAPTKRPLLTPSLVFYHSARRSFLHSMKELRAERDRIYGVLGADADLSKSTIEEMRAHLAGLRMVRFNILMAAHNVRLSLKCAGSRP